MRIHYSSKTLHATKTPLLLIHGSFHAAWCWEEHFATHFAKHHIPHYAVSLRGTAQSPAEPHQKTVTVKQHADDLLHLAKTLPKPPVLVAHSFGAAYVYDYLARGGPAAGACFLAPVPPSGNAAMVGRLLRRSPAKALLVTRALAFKGAARSPDLARAVFFDGTLPAEALERYVQRFADDSRVGLDLGDFQRNLPSAAARADGSAPWADSLPTCVIGGRDDVIVDEEGVRETARFARATPQLLDGLPHDLMLCGGWERAADRVVSWYFDEVCAVC